MVYLKILPGEINNPICLSYHHALKSGIKNFIIYKKLKMKKKYFLYYTIRLLCESKGKNIAQITNNFIEKKSPKKPH